MSFRDKADAIFLSAMRQANYWGRRRLPPGIRTLVGVVFVAGGLFGWLPILGFWMVPVGLVLIALDVPGLKKPVGRRLDRWIRRNAARRRRKKPHRQG